MAESILIVDDEAGVRRTFAEWLRGAGWDVVVHEAADAETALGLANREAIDLAVLDWNLGTGSDGLRLLEDLHEFQPEMVAILVTGYAAQATPLDALRRGVRDYLDKNQNLTRDSFLSAVRRQLDKLVPAKRERDFVAGLAAFRQSVEAALPLIRGAAAFHDPVPLPAAVTALLRFARGITGAAAAVLVVQRRPTDVRKIFIHDDRGGVEQCLVQYPGRTIAAHVIDDGEPQYLKRPFDNAVLQYLPCEVDRESILVVPVLSLPEIGAVLEVFDVPEEIDTTRIGAIAAVGSALLAQHLAENHTQRMLASALERALTVGGTVEATMTVSSSHRWAAKLAATGSDPALERRVLELVAAIRELALAHGPAVLDPLQTMTREIGKLLSTAT